MDGYEYSDVSSVYSSSEIQGYLERKKVLGNKSKLWCTLQKTVLCLQKKPGDPMKKIDLREPCQVRKVSSEVSGTHFEICLQKKKVYVFICPTSENCTSWVKALHEAMALKDTSKQHSAESGPSNGYVYDDCDDDMNPGKKKSSLINSEYAEIDSPEDEVASEDTGNDYWEVQDLQTKRGSPKAKPALDNSKDAKSSKDSGADQIPETTKNKEPQSDDQNCYTDGYSVKEIATNNGDQICYTDGYSVKEITTNTGDQISNEPSVLIRRSYSSTQNDANSRTSSNTYSSQYNSANPEPNKAGTVDSARASKPEHSPVQISIDCESDAFQVLTEALQDTSYTVPEFIHPLTAEDRKPLEELYQFLTNNQDICEGSDSVNSEMSDPVASLKSYIQTLNIASHNVNKS